MLRGHVRITQREGIFHSVELNGQDVSGALRGLNVNIRAGEIPSVTMNVLVEKTEGDFPEADLYIPEATRQLLIQFGWTPPVEEAP